MREAWLAKLTGLLECMSAQGSGAAASDAGRVTANGNAGEGPLAAVGANGVCGGDGSSLVRDATC